MAYAILMPALVCREGKERKGKERQGKERKGKERKGKERKGKERNDFASRCQCNERSSIVMGCPGLWYVQTCGRIAAPKPWADEGAAEGHCNQCMTAGTSVLPKSEGMLAGCDNQGKSEQGRAVQGWARQGQGRAGEGMAGEGRARQGRAGQDAPGMQAIQLKHCSIQPAGMAAAIPNKLDVELKHEYS